MQHGSVFDRAKKRRGVSADLLVVGIGNPGAQFVGTRHNIGVDVLEVLARRHAKAGTNGGLAPARKERSLIAEIEFDGARVVLAFPQTYMNLSGEALALLVPRYGIEEPRQVVIVQDELDLPVGALKIKLGGGHAGHNGLRSIDQHLGSRDYVRVRVGVGRPPGHSQGKDHVLRRPGSEERKELDIVVTEAADAIECYQASGLDETMNRYNRSNRQ